MGHLGAVERSVCPDTQCSMFGGGGGGAGKPDDEQSERWNARTGEGGDGGTLGGHHPDGAPAETYTLTNAAMGGGGGGGAGMQTREIGVSDGGDGANGLFLMVLIYLLIAFQMTRYVVAV